MVAALAAIGLGIWVQVGERFDLETPHVAGIPDQADRVDIDIAIQRVDAAGRELTLRVRVTPRGSLSRDGGLSPSEDLTLLTSPDIRQDLAFGPGGIGHSTLANLDQNFSQLLECDCRTVA